MTACCTMPGILMQTCFFKKYFAHFAFYIWHSTIFAYLPWKTQYRLIGAKLWIIYIIQNPLKINFKILIKSHNFLWKRNNTKNKCNEQKMNLQVCTKGNQYECKLCIVVLINVQGLICTCTSSVWTWNLKCKNFRKKTHQKLFLNHPLNLKMKYLQCSFIFTIFFFK